MVIFVRVRQSLNDVEEKVELVLAGVARFSPSLVFSKHDVALRVRC